MAYNPGPPTNNPTPPGPPGQSYVMSIANTGAVNGAIIFTGAGISQGGANGRTFTFGASTATNGVNAVSNVVPSRGTILLNSGVLTLSLSNQIVINTNVSTDAGFMSIVFTNGTNRFSPGTNIVAWFSNAVVAVEALESGSNHIYVTPSATGAVLSLLYNTNVVAKTGDTMSGTLVMPSATVTGGLFAVYRNSGQTLFSDLSASNQLTANALSQLGVGWFIKHHGVGGTRGLIFVNDSTGVLGTVILSGITNYPAFTFQNTHLGGIASLVTTGQMTGFHVGDGRGLTNVAVQVASNGVLSGAYTQLNFLNVTSLVASGDTLNIGLSGGGAGGSATNASLLVLNGTNLVGSVALANNANVLWENVSSGLTASLVGNVATNVAPWLYNGGTPMYGYQSQNSGYDGNSYVNNFGTRTDIRTTNSARDVFDLYATHPTAIPNNRGGMTMWSYSVGDTNPYTAGVRGPYLAIGLHSATSANQGIIIFTSARGTNDTQHDTEFWNGLMPNGAAGSKKVMTISAEGHLLVHTGNLTVAGAMIGWGGGITGLDYNAISNPPVAGSNSVMVLSNGVAVGSFAAVNFLNGTNFTAAGSTVTVALAGSGGASVYTNRFTGAGTTGSVTTTSTDTSLFLRVDGTFAQTPASGPVQATNQGLFVVRGLGNWQAQTGSVNVGYGKVLSPSAPTPSGFSATNDETYSLYGWTDSTAVQTSFVFGAFGFDLTGSVPFAVESTVGSGTHIFTVKDGSASVSITQTVSAALTRYVTNMALGAVAGRQWVIESRVSTTNANNPVYFGYDMTGTVANVAVTAVNVGLSSVLGVNPDAAGLSATNFGTVQAAAFIGNGAGLTNIATLAASFTVGSNSFASSGANALLITSGTNTYRIPVRP